jgi:hypothetical protein
MKHKSSFNRRIFFLLLSISLLFLVAIFLLILKLFVDLPRSGFQSNNECVEAFILEEKACPSIKMLEIIITGNDDAIVNINDLKLSIFNINLRNSIISFDEFNASFSEAQKGRVKLDPLIFSRNDIIYKFSNFDVRIFIWTDRKTKRTEGRVWFSNKDFSYSFELVDQFEGDHNDIVCDIKNLNSYKTFIEFLGSNSSFHTK